MQIKDFVTSHPWYPIFGILIIFFFFWVKVFRGKNYLLIRSYYKTPFSIFSRDWKDIVTKSDEDRHTVTFDSFSISGWRVIPHSSGLFLYNTASFSFTGLLIPWSKILFRSEHSIKFGLELKKPIITVYTPDGEVVIEMETTIGTDEIETYIEKNKILLRKK